jgi:hypothetical protein
MGEYPVNRLAARNRVREKGCKTAKYGKRKQGASLFPLLWFYMVSHPLSAAGSSHGPQPRLYCRCEEDGPFFEFCPGSLHGCHGGRSRQFWVWRPLGRALRRTSWLLARRRVLARSCFWGWPGRHLRVFLVLPRLFSRLLLPCLRLQLRVSNLRIRTPGASGLDGGQTSRPAEASRAKTLGALQPRSRQMGSRP